MRATVLAAVMVALACQPRAAPEQRQRIPAAAIASAAPAVPENRRGMLRMEALDPLATPPTFVMHGGPRGPGRLVFLHGMCGHGLGYAQAFQFNAAKRGTLIAPQGDVSCGGVWSKWSSNLAALDARIVATFRALGDAGPIDDIVVLGMSQGAMRAVELARKYPQRYTRLVAMDGPSVIAGNGLKTLQAAVLMAGERDRHDLMRQSQRALAAGGVPATFILIPEAAHGGMGPAPEKTMGQALDFLFQEQARPRL
jgi:pimeloyl-ACP methyl ester carboxylesterase